jgi:hypothetical protein
MLHVDAGKGKVKKILCYKFDEHVGNTSRILLLSLRTIRDAKIDIRPASHGQVVGRNFFSFVIFTG